MTEEIDMNVTQLTQAIDAARTDDPGVGLSVNRTVEDGMSVWDVRFATDYMMTIWSSEDERNTPTVKLAAEIIAGWDADWDD